MRTKDEVIVTFVNQNGDRDFDAIRRPADTRQYAAARGYTEFTVVGNRDSIERAVDFVSSRQASGVKVFVVTESSCLSSAKAFAELINAPLLLASEDDDYAAYRELGNRVLAGEDIPLTVVDGCFLFMQNFEQTFHNLYATIDWRVTGGK